MWNSLQTLLQGFQNSFIGHEGASVEFEFSIIHLENQSVTQAVFTMYGVKWMANPHPRRLWRVSVFSWLVQGSYLGGSYCSPILIPFPRRAAVPAHCTGTQAGGGKQVLGEGTGCLSCTWQKDSEARVSRQNKPCQIGQLFKTVCPTCRTHSDSRQFPGVNRPRERAKSKQRKGVGPEYDPQTNQEQHCIAGWVPDQFPKALTVLLRAPTPTPITRGLRLQALEFLRL